MRQLTAVCMVLRLRHLVQCKHTTTTLQSMQDIKEGTQTLLHGHHAPISCVCGKAELGLIFTADTGQSSSIAAWDTRNGSRALCIRQAHAHGVQCMDVSANGKQLVTVSCPQAEGAPQELSLWDISSTAAPQALVTVPVPAGDTQVRFTSHRMPFARCAFADAQTSWCVLVSASRMQLPMRACSPNAGLCAIQWA